MATVNAEVRFAPQLTAWFTANPTKVLQDGEIVYCSDGANVGKYVIGDNSTALSGLTFYGGISSSGLTIGSTTITSGTNTRILYNNAGVVGEYLVTGTGTTAVLSTSPTFTTDITTPTIYGNNGNLFFYQATQTSGALTPFRFITPANTGQTAATETIGFSIGLNAIGHVGGNYTNQRDIVFGGRTHNYDSATTVTNAWGLEVTAPTAGTNATFTNKWAIGTNGYILVIADTATHKIQSLVGTTSTAAWYMNVATPSASNYNIKATSSVTTINGTNTVILASADVTFLSANRAANNVLLTIGGLSQSGSTVATELNTIKVLGSVKGWAAGGGTLVTQRENYFTAATYTASTNVMTITNCYGSYFESCTASTNITITNNYAAGFSGNVNIIGTPHVSGVAGVDGTFTTVDGKTVTVSKGLITAIV